MYHDHDGGRIGPLAFCSFGDESKDQIILSGVARLRGKQGKGKKKEPDFVLHPTIPDTGKRERHVRGQPARFYLSPVLCQSQVKVARHIPTRSRWKMDFCYDQDGCTCQQSQLVSCDTNVFLLNSTLSMNPATKLIFNIFFSHLEANSSRDSSYLFFQDWYFEVPVQNLCCK